MSLRQWLLTGALVAAGCATSGGVSDRDIARLPVGERTQIVTAQHSIDVANSNLASARVARDEAKQFRKIASSELDAAKSRLDAARTGVDLGRSSRDDRTLRDAARNEDVARNQLIAARAKMDYADRLIELREAKVGEAQANVAAARADVETTKYRLVAAHDGDVKADGRKLEAARQDAQERLAEQRARVASLDGETAQLKTAWDDRRREFNTASRGDVRDLHAPPPPAPLPAQKHIDGRGDINDTPAAPAVPDSQQPQNNIAPAP
ncbi:MAG: hypothetical protein JWN44_3685 [Myxococcales bacterium]|nr:hypothetical protein [Myxococcales bacterium]